MLDMAERKPGRPRKAKTIPIQIRVTEAVAQALEDLARLNRRTRTQEIHIALEDRLRAADLWPDDAGEDE